MVPGEGLGRARFMLVGEQPGDKEDLAGKPFVGPAGRILDQALADAGIPRNEMFVTNAVKHFKFEMRGKRRLHKRPNAYEIERCKWWNDLERLIVKPDVVVALGATAARSLTGRTVTISKMRGEPIDLHDGSRLVITIHPSALLRTEDEADKRAKYRAFVKDLKAAARLVFKSLRAIIGPAASLRLLLFAELALDQGFQRIEHFGGLGTERLDRDGGAGAGGEHHQAHDRGAADLLAAALDPHLGVELLDRLHEFRRSAGVQAFLIDDLEHADAARRSDSSSGSSLMRRHKALRRGLAAAWPSLIFRRAPGSRSSRTCARLPAP